MKQIKNCKISDLVPDDKNFNKGTEFGNHLMDDSLRKFGLGRSILLDKNDRIISGNKTTEKAAELGFENVLVVETDGNTLVAVKRKDIDLDTSKGREFALADNATGEANLAWDKDVILSVAEEYDINAAGWGVDIKQEQGTYENIERAASREKDDFEEQFNATTDANCEMPIVPDFFETHECFVIVTHNSIDEAFVRDLFGLNEIYQSSSGDGKKRKTNVISVEKLRGLIK